MITEKEVWIASYAGYVIRDINAHMYIGTGEAEKVMLRQHAARFTKQEALIFIAKNDPRRYVDFSYSNQKFIIEDAT